MREIDSAPFLGFVGGVRGSAFLLEGELLIFEVLFRFFVVWGQNIVELGIRVQFGAFSKNIRGDFQIFDTAAQALTDTGFYR